MTGCRERRIKHYLRRFEREAIVLVHWRRVLRCVPARRDPVLVGRLNVGHIDEEGRPGCHVAGSSNHISPVDGRVLAMSCPIRARVVSMS